MTRHRPAALWTVALLAGCATTEPAPPPAPTPSERAAPAPRVDVEPHADAATDPGAGVEAAHGAAAPLAQPARAADDPTLVAVRRELAVPGERFVGYLPRAAWPAVREELVAYAVFVTFGSGPLTTPPATWTLKAAAWETDSKRVARLRAALGGGEPGPRTARPAFCGLALRFRGGATYLVELLEAGEERPRLVASCFGPDGVREVPLQPTPDLAALIEDTYALERDTFRANDAKVDDEILPELDPQLPHSGEKELEDWDAYERELERYDAAQDDDGE